MSRYAFSPEQCRAGGAKPDLPTRALALAAVARHGGSIKAAASELGMTYSKVKGIAYRDRRGQRKKSPTPFPRSLPIIADSGHRLVADRRVGVAIERRRFDCARLDACEMAWIAEHDGAQGRCPTGCKGYQKEERR